MIAGQVTARDVFTGHITRLGWANGRFTQIESAPGSNTNRRPRSSAGSSNGPDSMPWLAPPLLDLQVNGFAGVDFQRDDLTEADLLFAARALRRAGCHRFFLTLITDEWERLLARLERCRRFRQKSIELEQSIAGWHMEGPFLSVAPGFHGAHEPAWMRDPWPEAVFELRKIVGSDPLLLTLAPERDGAVAAIRAATAAKARVSLGHTNASSSQIQQAISAGAVAFTHLGNACPSQLDRHDNILWRVLDETRLTFSLIPDGIHVSPLFFRIAHRLRPAENIYYTTDAMAAAGAPPGRYTVGSLEVEVGPDQIVRQPGRSNFAGSALQPIEGIFRAARMLRSDSRSVWGHFSKTPERLMGLPASLRPEAPADFCLIEESAEHVQVRIFGGGQEISEFRKPREA